jgi:hypothetical protein
LPLTVEGIAAAEAVLEAVAEGALMHITTTR